jgi:Arc/MetJ family transcription regulator
MRTTVDISNDLLAEAQSILKTDSKKDTIEEALRKVISWHKRMQLVKYRGKIDLDIDLDALRGRSR